VCYFTSAEFSLEMIPKPCAAIFLVALALSGAACTHTPPGTSVELALAKRASVVRLPAPPPTPAQLASTQPTGPLPGGVQPEPGLPEQDPKLDRVAEAYSRGTFCLQAGRDDEAIAAFEDAVRLDPRFTEAWSNLAVLYEKTGQEQKAIEAFKKAKKIARQ
jgi:tetratricopeptide (TPR) repeat protein